METEKNQKLSNSEDGESNRRRGPLENLSKEELIAKCKGFLTLAQKAKQAKDEFSEKNKSLLAKLSEYETQKEADKGSLLTMKEIMDSLTQDKLSLTIKITDLETQNQKLARKTAELESEKIEQTENLIENEALKRQLKRLTDENEDLINDLEKMETKFLQTSKEYSDQQILNKKVVNSANHKFAELENKFKELNDENLKLKLIIEYNELSSKQSNISNTKELQENITEGEIIEEASSKISTELKIMKNKEILLLDEIHHLKNKINDVALKFKNLKGCRKVLMENEKDYSESVSKWQQDIKVVSQKLLAYIRAVENDKKELEMRLKLTEIQTNDNELNYILGLETKSNLLLEICQKVFIDFERTLNEVEELKLLIAKTQNSNDDLIQENTVLQANVSEMKNDSTKKLTMNSSEDEDIKKPNITIEEEKNTFRKSIEEHTTKYEKLEKEYKQIILTLKSTQDCFETLNLECEKLKKEVQNNKETEQLLKDEIRDIIGGFEQKNSLFKNSINENIETIDRLKSENSELLVEMRELNEALKSRGDVISRQETIITALETEIKLKFNQCTQETENKANENLALGSQLNQHGSIDSASLIALTADNQSDVISLSSITKAEDSKRMQEVNESLEEKHNKLKMLAIKMKKKIQEQKLLISKLEKNIIEESGISKIDSSHNDAKLNSEDSDKFSMSENKLNDQANEIKLLQNSLSSLNLLLNENEKKLEEEKQLRKSKEKVISEKLNDIKILKNEKEAFNLIRKELEKDRDLFKGKFTDKEKEIVKLNEIIEKLKKDVEKSKAIGKQSNVLNLEIEAYEKSLNEISEKLNVMKMEKHQLTESVQFKESVIESLKQEIKLLEESFSSEQTYSKELKKEMDIIQTSLKQIKFENMEFQSKLQDCTAENEAKHSQLEELRQQISEISVKKENQISEIKNEKENLFDQLTRTEEKLIQTEAKLKVIEVDFENLRTEFASYKIRAQSVLRQNQNKETSRERELEEELTTVQTNFETLKLKFTKSLGKVELQEKKIDELKMENEQVQKRCKETMDILEESRIQYDVLLEENRKQSKDYQESMKVHRLQIETLTSCYKEQITDLEQRHFVALEELEKNKSTTTISRVDPFGGSTTIEQPQKSRDEQKVEMLLMEREDAEGSEASYTLPKRKMSTRSRHDVIPLDELLNSSLDENLEYSHEYPKISAENEIEFLKDKLQSEELKSKHLSSLLSETEQDLIKYTQLNEVLKEELRRQERTLEREKHMPNSEYLKNVILKFLTLNNSDERIRLVPVLNTILRLSPDEATTLQNVAKSPDNNRSWNLLPLWSNNNNQ